MESNESSLWGLTSADFIGMNRMTLFRGPESNGSESGVGSGKELDVVNCTVQFPGEKFEKVSQLGDSDVFTYFVWPALIALAVIGAIFNILICSIICFSATFRRPVNYFIGNLSLVSTLMVVSIILRFQSDRGDLWNYSDTLCAVVPVLHRFPVSLIAFSVTIISLDRSKVVRHPLTFQTKFDAIRDIIVIWIFALVIEIPRGFYHFYDPSSSRNYKCSRKILFGSVSLHITYAVVYLVIVYIFPVIVMIIELSKLHAHLEYLSFCKTQLQEPSNIRKGIRLVKNAFTLTVIFIIFHLPIGILYFPSAIPKQVLSERILSYLPLYKDYIYIFGYLHGALYSVMIFLTSSELREHLYNCFSRPCCFRM